MTDVPILDLQRYLAILGLYDPDRLDGDWGTRTATAVHRYCDWQRIYGSERQLFEAIKQSARAVMPETDWTQVAGGQARTNAFVAACTDCCRKMGLGEAAQIAYVIATAEHETGGRDFLPNREADHVPSPPKAEQYRRNLRYYPYYGRGLIHWTWERNYAMAEAMLELPLRAQPDIALIPQVALFLLVWTMRTGKATGVALPQFVGDGKIDFRAARAVVNGADQQDRIANMAEQWLKHLTQEMAA